MIELADHVISQPQGVDYRLRAVELYEVKATKGSSILVLSAALNAQFMSFDLLSHLGHLIGRHGKVEPMSKCPDDCDADSRR